MDRQDLLWHVNIVRKVGERERERRWADLEVTLKRATDAKEIMNASSSKPAAAPATGTRLTLDDPDLYHRLMKECSEEERSIAGPVAASGPYVAPSFVTEYLKQNDVRPLKKVFILLNPVSLYTFFTNAP